MAITVGEEFDGISEIYDSTRQAATEAKLRAVSSELRGCSTILDVGVGTGRFAKPLSDLGFEIVGIDISRKMMLKARQSDEVIVTNISEIIKRFQQRSYSMQQDIPIDVHHKIIQKLLGSNESADSTGKEAASALQEKQVTRRIIEELAVWRPDQLRSG